MNFICISNVADQETTVPDEAATSEVALGVSNGCFIELGQLKDYANRGFELQCMNFVDFCVFTTHKKIDFDPSKARNLHAAGRRPGIRGLYRVEHPLAKTHYRLVCSNASKFLPSFVGTGFASPDDPQADNYILPACLFCTNPGILGTTSCIGPRIGRPLLHLFRTLHTFHSGLYS